MSTSSAKSTLKWSPEVSQYFAAAFGDKGLDDISQALGRPPLRTSYRVNCIKTGCKAAIQSLNRVTNSADLGGWQQSADVSDIVYLQGSGPHDIQYNDAGGKEVIISRRAGEAVLRGAHVFVPGVLACSQTLCKGDLVAVHVATEGQDAESKLLRGTFLDSRSSYQLLACVGKGIACFSRQDMFKADRGVGVEITGRVFRLAPCHELPPGLGMLQNLPSAVVAHVLNSPPGATVLDMCASPGGKATHLAQLMLDQGTVVALDRTHAKAQQIRNLAAELGLTSVQVFKMDATTALLPAQNAPDTNIHEATTPSDGATSSADGLPPAPGAGSVTHAEAETNGLPAGQAQPNAKELQRQERKAKARAMHGQAPMQPKEYGFQPTCKGFSADSFDYILLDAPCSALGLRPRLTHPTSLLQLRQTAAYQRKLLDVAVQLLRPGGQLVFSTCTINPGENEANVAWALRTFPLQLDQQQPLLGGPGLTGSFLHTDGYRERWLTAEQAGLVQRFDPRSELDTIGFFIAKFRKHG